jgi:hypothetical protein
MKIEVNNAKHELNELVIDFYEISYKITNKKREYFPAYFYQILRHFQKLLTIGQIFF